MTKQFELSAYGVEEMNQKELVGIEGGEVTAQDFIDLLEKVYGYIFGFLDSLLFDSMRGSIQTTGGLWVGGSPDSEFLHQALHGI